MRNSTFELGLRLPVVYRFRISWWATQQENKTQRKKKKVDKSRNPKIFHVVISFLLNIFWGLSSRIYMLKKIQISVRYQADKYLKFRNIRGFSLNSKLRNMPIVMTWHPIAWCSVNHHDQQDFLQTQSSFS